MHKVIGAVALWVLIGPATPIWAQPTQATPSTQPTRAPLVFVGLNAAYEPGTQTFGTKSSFSLYDEQGSFESQQSLKKGLAVDGTVLVRVWRNLLGGDVLVGAGLTGLNSTGGGTITATLPHPLIYDNPRSATGDVPSLTHRERAVLVAVAWRRPLANKLDVIVSLGPAFFDVKHDVITGIEFSETAPTFASIVVDKVNTARVHEKVGGFHLGGDVTYMVVKWIGAGAYVRWLGGSKVDVSLPDGASMTLKLGGFQFGGGLRARF